MDINYRKEKAKYKGGIFKTLDFIKDIWWEYGYSKERIFLWAIGFWMFFSLINLRFYHILSSNLYTIPYISKFRYIPKLNSASFLYYALHTLTYTGIIFFGIKFSQSNFKEGAVRNYFTLFSYLMFIFIVGLIFLGFIANIIFG